MMTRYVLIFFLCVSSFLLVYSCNEHKATAIQQQSDNTSSTKGPDTSAVAAIKKAEKLLQDGDLVMRSDNDFESLTLQNFSDSDRTYSHSGIAFKEDGQFMVYHSMTGSENPSGLCRKDPFDSFVSPARKTGFGIFRYQLSPAEKGDFHAALQDNITQKIPFDVTFNLGTDDSLYCSEMIYKALKKVSHQRINLPKSVLTNFRPKILGFKYNQVLLKKYEYIALDNLYLNPFCKEIARITY